MVSALPRDSSQLEPPSCVHTGLGTFLVPRHLSLVLQRELVLRPRVGGGPWVLQKQKATRVLWE